MTILEAGTVESELHFLYETVTRCKGRRVGRDTVWELAPIYASIPYSRNAIADLERLERAISEELPALGVHGKKRADKAFVRETDTITKPSYIARLTNGKCWSMSVSQRDLLLSIFARQPLSGGLAFSVFHPRDLAERRRPGYVPCLVAGTFLLHNNQLHLSAFFRSQSILEFGVHDLLFLRRWQQQFVDSIASIPREAVPQRIRPQYRVHAGPLNLHFSRVVIPARLARNRKGYVHRGDVLDRWVEVVVQTIETCAARSLQRNSVLKHELGNFSKRVRTPFSSMRKSDISYKW
jgi:hypothetical protein